MQKFWLPSPFRACLRTERPEAALLQELTMARRPVEAKKEGGRAGGAAELTVAALDVAMALRLMEPTKPAETAEAAKVAAAVEAVMAQRPAASCCSSSY
jgi:molybdenum-dependent DNA-binding transcriptional regulator ModE